MKKNNYPVPEVWERETAADVTATNILVEDLKDFFNLPVFVDFEEKEVLLELANEF